MTFGFVIVGTPRSGTTLVQRLTNELDGVRTPPETHVLTRAEYGDLDPDDFPMRGPDLERAVGIFVELHGQDGLHLDAADVIARLDGEANSVIDLYIAIAMSLAGPAAMVGEKTPSHLVWWRELTTARPDLKVIAIVREPRAVVASNLEMPFGMTRLELLAERWVCDQDETAAALDVLGPERCLLVRYEDVVADPDRVREALATFVGRPLRVGGHTADGPLFVAKEWWKERAEDEITADASYGTRLSAAQQRRVLAICRRHLDQFGYGPPPSWWETLRCEVTLSPAARVRRWRFRASRRSRRRCIERFAARS